MEHLYYNSMLSADDLNKYIVFIRSMLSRYISETIQNIAIVTMEGEYELVCDLSNAVRVVDRAQNCHFGNTMWLFVVVVVHTIVVVVTSSSLCRCRPRHRSCCVVVVSSLSCRCCHVLVIVVVVVVVLSSSS